MSCLPRSSSKPAVVDNYRSSRYEEEHNSPSNQRRIAFRQQLYREEHDSQLAVALRAQERSDEYDLDVAIALSKSMMDDEMPVDYDEEQAISIARALSLSEAQDIKEIDTELKEGDAAEVSETKKIPEIEDDQFQDIGEVSKVDDLHDRHIV